MERADFLSRAIEASRRLASLPKTYGGAESEWDSVLLSSGSAESFAASGRPLEEEHVVEYLTFAADNPVSYRSTDRMVPDERASKVGLLNFRN
jgi:uncharacterized alpha-E superfamily protein